MATPTNVELLEPYIVIEAYVTQDETDVYLGMKDSRLNVGYVRGIYSGCTRVAEDDRVFFLNDQAYMVQQEAGDFRVLDVNKVVFISTFTAPPPDGL